MGCPDTWSNITHCLWGFFFNEINKLVDWVKQSASHSMSMPHLVVEDLKRIKSESPLSEDSSCLKASICVLTSSCLWTWTETLALPELWASWPSDWNYTISFTGSPASPTHSAGLETCQAPLLTWAIPCNRSLSLYLHVLLIFLLLRTLTNRAHKNQHIIQHGGFHLLIEDSVNLRVGGTRILSPHASNNCTGRISWMDLNSGFCWRLAISRGSLGW